MLKVKNVTIAKTVIFAALVLLLYGFLQNIPGLSLSQSGLKISPSPPFRPPTANRRCIYTIDKNTSLIDTRVAKNSMVEHGYLMLNESVYYCDIPKCGSSFLGMFIRQIFPKDNNDIGTVSENVFTIKIPRNISGAYAFTFVREPYSRLFSAFENKLFHPNEFWKILGVDVIKEVRKTVSSSSGIIGHDISFHELVEYVVKLSEEKRTLNPHLAPMHTICNPCRQNFDYIGRLETMTDDLLNITREWTSRGIVSINTKETIELESATKSKRYLGRLKRMFRQLKTFKYFSKYMMFLRNWSSYQIRGIILKEFELPFTEENTVNISKYWYEHAVVTAIEASEKRSAELKVQRKEALMQAYSTVPMDLLYKLREFVKIDCHLFGYEDQPDIIFDRKMSAQLSTHNYFKGQ